MWEGPALQLAAFILNARLAFVTSNDKEPLSFIDPFGGLPKDAYHEPTFFIGNVAFAHYFCVQFVDPRAVWHKFCRLTSGELQFPFELPHPKAYVLCVLMCVCAFGALLFVTVFFLFSILAQWPL